MITFVLVILAALLLVPLAIGYFVSAPRYSGAKSDHFDGRSFVNRGAVSEKRFGEAIKWMLTGRNQGPWTERKEVPYGPKPAASVKEGIRVTFVNHATFLVQMDGLNILTDPIWSKRPSPLSFAGPKRMRPPGIRFEDLPKIDVIIISHNHYDHLDIPSLKRLSAEYSPRIICPLGIKQYLDDEHISNVVETDWWGSVSLNNNVRVHPVPAQHFSGRGLFDRNGTLWCGYVIENPAGNLFFAGDTGYNQKMFAEIGQRFAPIKLALLPIGAYMPEWFMGPIHISPDQAVLVSQDLKAETSIAMHFGTFPLGDDGEKEPVLALEKAKQKYKIDNDKFRVLEEGSFYEIKADAPQQGAEHLELSAVHGG